MLLVKFACFVAIAIYSAFEQALHVSECVYTGTRKGISQLSSVIYSVANPCANANANLTHLSG